MKKVLLGAASIASFGFAGSAAAQCGEISVGAPNWSTAEIVAEVDAFILANGLGCTVSMVPAPTTQVLPLAQGASVPLLVGEFWSNGVDAEELDDALEDGILEVVGKPFPEAGEFWYVSPAFAAAYPELDTVEEVLSRPDLFPSSTVEGTGAFFGCPIGIGWGCEHSNRNLYVAWGLEDRGWTLENPGSFEGMNSIIIDAYNTDSNWVGYYWTPTAVAINNELVALDWDREFVGNDAWSECYSASEPEADCEFVETAYTPSTVVSAATPSLSDYPGAYAYAQARMMSMPALGAADEKVGGGMTAAEAAEWYLETYDDEWSAWVDADTADAVRSAL